ncbi:hypothetical protein O181_010426 [Austropuccinia psidii MF-1]|uniref:FCP1 homology domain-containing protein n=1 Tax=Austropuccinia psidii MF-1 TaxID=1389203 RepID=A0A9Q3GKE2_9BASI|nr:hypothetical protein [Austropuccinia psidii MF-1]
MSDSDNQSSTPTPSGNASSTSIFSEHISLAEDEPSKRLKLEKLSSQSNDINSTLQHLAQPFPTVFDQPSSSSTRYDQDSQPAPNSSQDTSGDLSDQENTTPHDHFSPSPQKLELVFTWKDTNLRVALDGMVTVGDLKVVLYSLTAVPPERQKILGLVPGKIPGDEVPLSMIEFKLQRGSHFKLLGSPEEDTILRPTDPFKSSEHVDPQVARKVHASQDCVLYLNRVQAKLDEIDKTLQLNIMNPSRPGKKLLVLDLDYTLMDSKAYSDYSVHALDMARPYLHEFLTALWPYYDFCIWSATSWRWLESKLIELGMVGGKYTEKYLIQFVLDREPMFEVTSMRHGKISKHEVKALELIWRKVSAYNATNTLHLDDLSRNFVLNPRSGVKISAFKNARENKHDRQLVFLARYFLQIACLPDVRTVDHRKWADCQLPLPMGVPDPFDALDASDPELIRFKSRRHRHHKRDST